MYAERRSRLGGGTVVWSRAPSPRQTPDRVLPDGCMDLIWSDGLPGSGLLVAGPDTRAHVTDAAPAGVRWTGLRFAPGAGPAVLGVPANELRDQRVPLEDLWPQREVRQLAEQAAEAADPADVLESVRRHGGPPDPLCGPVLAALRQGRGVDAAARAAGIGPRQLRRRAQQAFGYGPKTLARVLRMRHALRLAREGVPLARVAVAAGYADQAHLAREVKSLAGVPVTRLLG